MKLHHLSVLRHDDSAIPAICLAARQVLAITACLPLFVCSCDICDMDDNGDRPSDTDVASDSDSADETHGTGDDGQVFTVSGTVVRIAPVPPDNDGKGTLYVGALETCDQTMFKLLGATAIPNADVSDCDAALPYSITGLPSGTVHLVAFLDDDGNAQPTAPLPDAGDLVYAASVTDGVLNCIEVSIVGEDVNDVTITLNAVED